MVEESLAMSILESLSLLLDIWLLEREFGVAKPSNCPAKLEPAKMPDVYDAKFLAGIVNSKFVSD
jgi:hypothetical protein